MKLTPLVVAIGAVALSVKPGIAQQPSASDRCTKAGQEVRSGRAGDTALANALIVGCPDGPAAIASRWRTTDERRGALMQLRTWNLQISDQRIAEAAMEAARDATRPTDVRLVALETLIGYFEPGSTMRWEQLRDPPQFPTLAALTDVSPRIGTQPPAADMPQRVYALSRDMVTDPNPIVARAAKAVWQALTDARPAIASLPPGTLSLVNVCGQKFRIANQSDIDLSVELIVASGQPANQARIPAHGSLDLRLAVNDTLRLFFAGKEVASAATGQVECR